MFYRIRNKSEDAIKPAYECKMHGSYRTYSDHLIGMKNWGMLWTTLAIVPLTMLLHAVNVRSLYCSLHAILRGHSEHLNIFTSVHKIHFQTPFPIQKVYTSTFLKLEIAMKI